MTTKKMTTKMETLGFRFSGYKNIIYSLLIFVLILAISGMNVNAAPPPPNIKNITLNPDLNIIYFGDYNVTANITDADGVNTAYVNVSGINKDGGNCWQYYVNGSCAKDTPEKRPMSPLSGDIYVASLIRPDHIYPQIEFGDDDIFWYNQRQKTDLWRNNYHIFHFTNNYTMMENMSFWIEFDTIKKATTSNAIQVYLVKQGQSITFFNQNWLVDPKTQFVGSVTISTPYDHHHPNNKTTDNSSHYLIKLTTNSDGTVGANNLNISGDFWIVLYANMLSSTTSWNLSYRDDSLCNNSAHWYVGDRGAGWTTTHQNGCPDAHVHFARDLDCANMTVCANDTSGEFNCSSKKTCFTELPNLPPTPTGFLYPKNGTYCGNINIAWAACIDPNGDPVTYNLTLRNLDGSLNLSINENLAATSYLWNSNLAQDGTYDLSMICCDPSNACSNFTLSQDYDNFTINNTSCPAPHAVPAFTPIGISILIASTVLLLAILTRRKQKNDIQADSCGWFRN